MYICLGCPTCIGGGDALVTACLGRVIKTGLADGQERLAHCSLIWDESLSVLLALIICSFVSCEERVIVDVSSNMKSSSLSITSRAESMVSSNHIRCSSHDGRTRGGEPKPLLYHPLLGSWLSLRTNPLVGGWKKAFEERE